MVKLIQDGDWSLRNSPRTGYYYLQHYHPKDDTWKWATVAHGVCAKCNTIAPERLIGFKRLCEWKV